MLKERVPRVAEVGFRQLEKIEILRIPANWQEESAQAIRAPAYSVDTPRCPHSPNVST